jgi:hypothetical protein
VRADVYIHDDCSACKLVAVSAAPDQELTPPRNESNFPTPGSDLAAVGIWRPAVKYYTPILHVLEHNNVPTAKTFLLK